jgi:hypothetical protein
LPQICCALPDGRGHPAEPCAGSTVGTGTGDQSGAQTAQDEGDQGDDQQGDDHQGDDPAASTSGQQPENDPGHGNHGHGQDH